ncbi:Citrate synthase-lysine N-methyltransferase CSKMT, mitochondrial, partial [Lamellibrachia satsuma]
SGLYSEMSKQVYWDEFYNRPTHDRPFDWLLKHGDVRDLLEAQLPRSGRFTFLDVGCGTSGFASNVVLQDRPNVQTTGFCLDFSQPALFYQRKHHQRDKSHYREKGASPNRRMLASDDSGLYFLRADARHFPFRQGLFDFVVDKGTTDAVLKDTENGVATATRILEESLRVLKDSGTLWQITDEDPELRASFLLDRGRHIGMDGLRVSFRSIEPNRGGEYFVYTIRKPESAEGKCPAINDDNSYHCSCYFVDMREIRKSLREC